MPVNERRVGVRELKARLSRYLRDVKEGGTIVVTERGGPVGRIVPAELPLDARLQALVRTGLAAWNGRKLEPMSAVARVRGRRTVASLLLKARQ